MDRISDFPVDFPVTLPSPRDSATLNTDCTVWASLHLPLMDLFNLARVMGRAAINRMGNLWVCVCDGLCMCDCVCVCEAVEEMREHLQCPDCSSRQTASGGTMHQHGDDTADITRTAAGPLPATCLLLTRWPLADAAVARVLQSKYISRCNENKVVYGLNRKAF